MEKKKTSKKPGKSAEAAIVSANPAEPQPPVSKPAKRASAASKRAAAEVKSASRKSAESKKSNHRHSRLALQVLQTPSIAASVNAPSINYDEVAKLAYRFWEERQFAHGFAEEDWHRAEKQISDRL